jgi:hypothetical protein
LSRVGPGLITGVADDEPPCLTTHQLIPASSTLKMMLRCTLPVKMERGIFFPLERFLSSSQIVNNNLTLLPLPKKL